MTPRETAERHAQDVVDGDLSRIVGDVAGDAELGGRPGRTPTLSPQEQELRPLLEANGAIIQGTGTHAHVAVQLRERMLSTT